MTDTAVLPGLLKTLRLPTMTREWRHDAQIAERDGWPPARFLAILAELEVTERLQRRIQRHQTEAGLPAGKCLATFDFAAADGIRKPQVMAMAEGGAWLTAGQNVLAFGPSGTGKSDLAAAIGKALVDAGWRVRFWRTIDLVQTLQQARRDLALTTTLEKLDKYDLLVLDDFSYVRKDQAETSVLFELIAHRYERRSLMITANQAFNAWTEIFPDPAMTVAAIDRLVHHATILEFTGPSYRRRNAVDRKNAAPDCGIEEE